MGSCTIVWLTAFDKDSWNRITQLAASYSPNIAGESRDELPRDFIDVGTALPPGKKGGHIAELVCTEAGERGGQRIIWGLTLRPRPTSPPPKRILEEHAKLGGKSGLLKLITSCLGDEALPAANYKLGFTISAAAGWSCKIVPKDVPQANLELAVIGRSAKMQHVGYSFENGILGINELSIFYVPQNRQWNVRVEARAPLKIDSNIELPFYHDVTEFVLAQLFTR